MPWRAKRRLRCILVAAEPAVPMEISRQRQKARQWGLSRAVSSTCSDRRGQRTHCCCCRQVSVAWYGSLWGWKRAGRRAERGKLQQLLQFIDSRQALTQGTQGVTTHDLLAMPAWCRRRHQVGDQRRRESRCGCRCKPEPDFSCCSISQGHWCGAGSTCSLVVHVLIHVPVRRRCAVAVVHPPPVNMSHRLTCTVLTFYMNSNDLVEPINIQYLLIAANQ